MVRRLWVKTYDIGIGCSFGVIAHLGLVDFDGFSGVPQEDPGRPST